ncbi:MAG TPA: hypothetical protein VEI83_12155 [Acidimicrobiales bacterium]|nr:hypothetical protein [Acidimicrobiales bacterium]
MARGLGCLVAWFERVGNDEHYADPAPTEATAALTQMSRQGRFATIHTVVVGRATLRVAQEVVAYRWAIQCGSEVDEEALERAEGQLLEVLRRA